MPSKHHPDETRILWFIALYPDKLKAALFLGAPTSLFFIYIYFKFRQKRDAILSFDADKIELRGKGWSRIFPVPKVRYFDCYDPYTKDGFPQEKFTLEIRNWNGKAFLINLKDYSQANRLVEILTVFEEVKLNVKTEKPTIGLSNDQI